MRILLATVLLSLLSTSAQAADTSGTETASGEPARRAVFLNPLGTVLFVPAGVLFLSGGISAPVSERVDAAFELNYATQLTCRVLDAPCARMNVFAGTLSFPFHPTQAGTSRGFFIAPKLTSAFALGQAFRLRPDRRGADQVGVGASATVGLDVGIRADLEFGYLALVVGASLGYGTNIPITTSDDTPGRLHDSALSEWAQSTSPQAGDGLVYDLNLQFAQIGFWF